MTSQKEWLRFLLITTSLGTLSWLCYEFFVPQNNSLDRWLNGHIASLSSNCLVLCGYTATVLDGHVVSVANKPLLSVGSPCNGLKLYAVFAIFVIGFTGSHTHKLWFIPLGILSIFGLNILRVVILTLNVIHSPRTFDFNHRYLFEVLVYAFIFALWISWTKKFAVKN